MLRSREDIQNVRRAGVLTFCVREVPGEGDLCSCGALIRLVAIAGSFWCKRGVVLKLLQNRKG